MGKSLVIPGADFSAVAIPFIAKVTIAANKAATIYSGDGNAIATIPATEKEKTVDLTDILSEAGGVNVVKLPSGTNLLNSAFA